MACFQRNERTQKRRKQKNARTQGGPFRLETSLFARGVWGKGVSKRKGPLEIIRLSAGCPMGAARFPASPPERNRRRRSREIGGPKPRKGIGPAGPGEAP